MAKVKSQDALLENDELVLEADDVVAEAAWLRVGRGARFDSGEVLRDDVALARLGGDFADADEGAFEDFVGLAHGVLGVMIGVVVMICAVEEVVRVASAVALVWCLNMVSRSYMCVVCWGLGKGTWVERPMS